MSRQPTWAEIRERVATKDLGVQEHRDPETDELLIRHAATVATALGSDGQEHGLTVSYAPEDAELRGKWSRFASLALANRMNAEGVWFEPIDTTNRFMVGTSGDRISAMAYQAGQRMTKDEALTFAAWLIMCADMGEMARFTDIFDAIKAT